MLDPINALFASSCSKKGINEAETENACCGETSIKSTLSGGMKENSFLCLTGTNSSVNLLFESRSALACAITKSPSSIADK